MITLKLHDIGLNNEYTSLPTLPSSVPVFLVKFNIQK
jgi:hypothetical protein